MVAIVGRPNVGKSTLLNRLMGEKVAIVSNVPQTTRNQVRGIYSDQRGQIVFVDTPGVHANRDRLDKYMNKAAYAMIEDTDCIIHLVDTKDPVGKEEEEIVKKLLASKISVILGLNKVDIKTKYIPDYIQLWERVSGKPATKLKKLTLLPLSGKEGINIDKLFDFLFSFLPKGPALYPQDTLYDVPQRMVIADIVREKLLNIMRHEIPHSLAVIIESIEPRRRKTLYLRVLIVVESESQKKIVIGKSGQILKKVGIQAREELEDLLESKIFLEIFVKQKKKWRDDGSLLEEMGYVSI